MTNVIHSNFLTVAEAMTSAFSSIEKNQSWDLMPSLVPELALCLYMLHRALNLHCIELEYEKANKQMMELLTGEAASILSKGHSCTVTTNEMAEKYGLNRRQARRIRAKAMDYKALKKSIFSGRKCWQN